ncbi:MAG TPA: hypothetical protein DCP90_06160 [Clostridiales bacterium]|nr:MAG: hypothetical protein A2Y22_09140 [Clostridiales bacterium GWD2_32_59]HAN10178.1 hypothetical protein [Clostridiales bacterium]
MKTSDKSKKLIVLGCILVIVLIAISYLVLNFMKNPATNIENVDEIEGNKTNQTGTTQNQVEVENKNSIYIKDKEVGSYIWFSGNNWIILNKADDGIVLISADPIAILNYNYEDNNEYDLSYLRVWLNQTYYKTLNNKALLIPQTFIWRENEDGTNNSVTDNIGMLTKDEYIKYKGILNISKYNWTMSAPSYALNQAYCISNDGKLNVAPIDSKYGVTPVIKISNTISLKSGEGTKASPYKLKQESIAKTGEKLNTRHSGEYITYSGFSWRIVDVNTNLTTKIVCNSAIWFQGFDTRNIPSYNPKDKYNIANFLNTVFYENLENKHWIVLSDWYIRDIGYMAPAKDPKKSSQYDKVGNNPDKKVEKSIEQVKYEQNKVESISANVGLLRLGELITTTDINADWWLITQPNDSTTKIYYVYYLSGIISQADAFTNFPARPAINIDESVYITGGEGTIDNPYTINK